MIEVLKRQSYILVWGEPKNSREYLVNYLKFWENMTDKIKDLDVNRGEDLALPEVS